jgi:hypothetical protein
MPKQLSTPLPSLIGFLCLAVTAAAQTWQLNPVATGLDHPTGIALDASGQVWFTEVPTPGVPGSSNGRNRVASLDVATGMITTRNSGEPEPVNLAVAGNGDVYWTCRSAGVVLRRSASGTAPFATMLSSPSGISVTSSGEVLVTLLPTPGMPGNLGGMNAVGSLTGSGLTILNQGEPDPVDIAATPSGDFYWTCRSAGVILRRDGATGAVAPVLRGLERPSGIAADGLGNLYFTEIPTPGVPGSAGGRNRVWKFEPAAQDLTLISMGEPEPNDVAVSNDGSRVYWTCTSAGVIMRAVRTGDAPRVIAQPVAVGATLRSFLHAPMAPGAMYLAASATRLGAIRLPDGRGVGLAMDSLFYGTLLDAASPLAVGYLGLLDANGMGTAQLVVPASMAMTGLAVHTAFVTVDPMASMGIGAISATHRTVLQ